MDEVRMARMYLLSTRKAYMTSRHFKVYHLQCSVKMYQFVDSTFYTRLRLRSEYGRQVPSSKYDGQALLLELCDVVVFYQLLLQGIRASVRVCQIACTQISTWGSGNSTSLNNKINTASPFVSRNRPLRPVFS